MKPIPSPRSLPIVGTMLSILAAGGAPKLHLYVDKRHRELGPIYREKIGPVTGVFIADGNWMRKIFAWEGKYPKHIVPESWLLYNKMYECKRGLLFMDDEEWFNLRKIMNNLMLKLNQDEFYKAATTSSETLIENWKEGGQINNLESHLYKWSLEVIAAVLLGSENYKQEKKNLSGSIEELADKVHQIFIESAALSLIPVKIAAGLKLPAWKRFVLSANSVIEEGKKMVEKLLAMERQNKNKGGLITEMLHAEINLEDLKRIVMDLVLAAGDTTAHTMQWLLHLLSKDLSIQEHIYNEITEHEADISKCQVLKGSLKEALRLYPVAPFITRFMPQDIILDEFQIKANELVLMSLYSSGRNEKYFPSPTLFSPGRWLRNEKGYKGVINPNASLPFAMGSRSCIGKKLAETQILITTAKILQNFAITSNKVDDIDIVLHLISVPSEPIVINLKPRNTE